MLSTICFLKRSRYINDDFRENDHKTVDFQKRPFWVVYTLGMSIIDFVLKL